MAKTFTSMKTNIGNMVMDTSSDLATLIGRWLNDKYLDVWRRYNWSDTINNDYTITLASGTATYSLPLDFEQEINVSDITDGFELKRMTEGLWWKERAMAYSAGSISNSTSRNYIILWEKLNTAANSFGMIGFDPAPNNTHTIAMPYKRRCSDMITVTGTCTTNTASKVIASASTFITSGVEPGMRLKNTTDSTYGIISSVDSETQLTMETDVCPDGNETFEIYTFPVIRNIEYILECGAVSEAFAYKKNFSKASDFLQKYEYELQKRIREENIQANQKNQWIPEIRKQGIDTPFTGWESYDSI